VGRSTAQTIGARRAGGNRAGTPRGAIDKRTGAVKPTGWPSVGGE